MIVLGIETATHQVGVAVAGPEGVLASTRAAGRRRHAELLTPMIEVTMRHAGAGFPAVGVVAVDVGPGLFTGLRVGVATAKAVAQALRAPMVGLSSLDLLAFAARLSDRLIVPVIDARKGEIFTASYRHVPGGVQRLSPHILSRPEELAAELAAVREDCLLVGDGALRYSELLGVGPRVALAGPALAYPSPAALVELARPLALREEFVSPSEISVAYLRKSDAEIDMEGRVGV